MSALLIFRLVRRDFLGTADMKRAESALRDEKEREKIVAESQARLKLALSAARMGVWERDIRTDKVICSPECQEIWEADLPLEKLADFKARVHPDDIERVMAAVESAVAKRESYAVEYRIIRSDGATRWLTGIAQCEYAAEGQPARLVGTVQDITESKIAADAIRQSREMLRLVLDNIPQGVFWKDRDSRFIGCNQVVARRLGLSSPDEIAGHVIVDFPKITPEQAALLFQSERVVMDTNAPQLNIVESITAADGKTIWLETNKVPMHDADGRVIGILGTSEDITERREAEEALRAERDRFTTIAATAPGVICSLRIRPDHSASFLYTSPGITSIFGLQPEEIAEDALVAFKTLHPDDVNRVRQSLRQSSHDLVPWWNTFRVCRAGGPEIWIEGHGAPIREPDGGTLWHGFLIDVSDRKRDEAALKQSEQALRESEERSRLAQEAGQVGIFDWDALTNRSVWTTEQEAIYGLSPGEFGGSHQSWANRIHPTDQRWVLAELAQAVAEKRITNEVEYRIVRPDGETRWISNRGRLTFAADGSFQRLIGTTIDITGRKRSEAEQQKLVILIQHSRDFIAITDLEGQVTFINAGGRRMIGVDETQDVSQFHYDDYVPPELHDFFRKTVLRTAFEQGMWQGEMQMRHVRTGARIDVYRTTFLIRDAAGDPSWYATVTRDITEQKRSEQALRDRERLLRIVTSSARVGLVVVSDRYEYLFANEAYAEIFGLVLQEIVGRHVYDLLPNGWSQIQSRLDRALAGERVAYELTLPQRPDATEPRWFRVIYEPRATEDNGRLTVVVVVMEITEDKRKEQLIRASEERYRRLVDVLPSAIFIHTGTEIVFCNPAFVRLMGADRHDELLGKNPFDVIAPEYQEAFRGRVAAMQVSGEAVGGVEKRIVRLDGRTVPVYSVSTALPDPDDRPLYLVALSDLTDRERSMELLRSVMRSVPDAILTIDERGNVQSANPAVERLFGFSVSEVVGKNVKMLSPEPFRTQHDDYIANYIQTGIAKLIGVGRESEGLRKDGTLFPVDLTVTEFLLDGERHFTGLIRDITARKNLEAQFQQAQKMEAVGRLAGGVAHDFNNLLTVINGYGDLLLMDLPHGSPQRGPIVAIRDAGERAARLTQQLLAFSRKAIVEPKVLDLNELVGESAKLLRRLIGEDVVLAIVADPSLARIKADPGQIEQVIMNLVVNARDAMPTGGRLTVETRDVHIASKDLTKYADMKPGRFAELMVDDSGEGMADDVKSKIFEPFFTTKGVGKGTGLGLAVVHGVMKQLGGHIGVESAVGVGTTFKLLFPTEPEVATGAETGVLKVTTRGTETVLLVEDEDAVRTIARIALETYGFKVMEAGDGMKALQMAKDFAGAIDVLVTDVVMPEMGGRQLAEQMRAQRPRLRVLYMSGYTDDAVLVHGVSAATDAFLQKPFTPLGLTRKVRAVLDARP